MALTGPHRRAPRWIVAAGGLLAAVALGEAIARIEGPGVCADAATELLQADPEVGWTFVPDLSVTLDDCRGDGYGAAVTTNAHGLADEPRSYEKRPRDVRVLVLGGRVADGLGVAREDRFSVRIAHLADRTRGARVSVVNGAIPGYGLAEQLRWLEKRGLRYAPDLVVLVLDPVRHLAATLHPPVAEPIEPDVPPASGLLALSGLARWMAGRPDLPPGTRVRVDDPAPLSGEEEHARALEETRRLVARLAATTRDAGARFAVLVAPPCPPVSYDPGLCAALEDIAPCVDPGPTFDDLRRTSTKPLELCLDRLGRWGRDGHFLASHALWDLLGRAELWPEGVVRGHRL